MCCYLSIYTCLSRRAVCTVTRELRKLHGGQRKNYFYVEDKRLFFRLRSHVGRNETFQSVRIQYMAWTTEKYGLDFQQE